MWNAVRGGVSGKEGGKRGERWKVVGGEEVAAVKERGGRWIETGQGDVGRREEEGSSLVVFGFRYVLLSI